MYDCDNGCGGREIIYHELDGNGDVACGVYLWNSTDGRYYFIDSAQSDCRVVISEEEWHGIGDLILALQTELIPRADCPKSHAENLASEKLTWLGESRNDSWPYEDNKGIFTQNSVPRKI